MREICVFEGRAAADGAARLSVIRTGIGIDTHRFAPGRPLILGGVEIPHELGLAGHSDADVLAHAIIDALLGAAGRATSASTSRTPTRATPAPTRSPCCAGRRLARRSARPSCTSTPR